MAGMTHFRNALAIAARDTATAAEAATEKRRGHDQATGHGAARATAAGHMADAAVQASAGITTALATWLAALDARYAAGVHAGPIMSNVTCLSPFGSIAKYGCQECVRSAERDHGHDPDRDSPGPVGLGDNTKNDVKTAVTAEVDLWLADLDARYAAGVCATAPGVVMAGASTAVVTALELSCDAIVTYETLCRNHWDPLHWTPHVNDTIATVDGLVVVSLPTILQSILTAFDARYAAHA